MTKGQAPVTLVVQQHLSVLSAHSNCVQLDGSRYSKRSEVKASLSLLSLNHDPELSARARSRSEVKARLSLLSLNHELAPVLDIHPMLRLTLELAALEVEEMGRRSTDS